MADLFFFFQIILAILGPLNFTICLPIFAKKATQILMDIAFPLCFLMTLKNAC
jgi:hypothetical protein